MPAPTITSKHSQRLRLEPMSSFSSGGSIKYRVCFILEKNEGDAPIRRWPGGASISSRPTRAEFDKPARIVSLFDDTPEVVVPPGHVFVLGDNRDRAADSRVPPDITGAGMVPVSAILGRAMYFHWSADIAAVGKRLDS